MKKQLITLSIIVAAVLCAPSAAAVTSGYKTVAGHTISVSTDANSYTPRAKSIDVTARKTGSETVYYRFTLQKRVGGKWKDQRFSLVGSFKTATPTKEFYTVNHTAGTHRIKMTIYKNKNWTGVKDHIYTPAFEVRK
ncbi:hypothetical protein K3L72_10105 [Bacillus altitudinis]|uniref:Uncharacterized protein n=1 Tax=Bacillus altitudinis TaxID=293387 RepID=A0ABV1S2M8_BACAB|nr:hypothetical protein [Bacillus altitudinis]MBY0186493.1 hypothetical protein [Bacillus aerophilus]MCW4358135.1 hypothetical protein [Bacillus altitudinis]MCY7579332.1 hypothetical protein [Bacillus altitudinis]MCY7594643.1 hypothetical protein [Bacillus altitudinis]WJE31519.1 hypothetical protein QRD87_06475 [Bacillus altitudinis]